MSTAADHVLDRHVLSSGPALVDSGKDTFAWTSGLAGERAARLKNEVPWGVSTAGAENPPRLEGKDVLSEENYLRLHFAWIPLDNRMGFCVWGAIGDRPLGRSVWRVLTHTVLMDADAFRAMESNPFALLKRGVAGDWVRDLAAPGSFDERGPVEPIRVAASAESREIAEKLRRDDITRLRGRLVELLGVSVLQRRLEALYAALASTQHVALASTPDRQAEMLVRLAWLTLPPVDRWQTSFSTEQGASAGVLPRLMALNLAEWQGRVPPETFLFAGDPPEGSKPSKGQLMWAADVARQESGREHAHAHAYATGVEASLLSGGEIDRYARHRDAVREVCAGTHGTEALRRLAEPQFSGLLSLPRRAGLLLGLSLRGTSLAPAEMVGELRKVLEQLPHEGRDVVARGMVCALALGDDATVLDEADADVRMADGEPAGERPLPEPRALTAEFRAAALLRCAAVSTQLVSAVELTRLLESEPEGALLTPLLKSPGGPAALILAIPAAGDPELLDRLGPLGDRAMEALPENELEPVLEALKFGSEWSAAWGVQRYEAAERQRGYRPSAQVLWRLLDYVGHPVVRAYLARRESLHTALSPAFAEHAGSYIDAVKPDPLIMADALVEVTSQIVLTPAAPPSRVANTFAPPGPTSGPSDGVAAALKYLRTTADVRSVINLWRDGSGEPNARLLLLSHRAWGTSSAAAEHARNAAAVLVERAPAPGTAPALEHRTVTAALREVVEDGTTAFSVAEGRLAVAGVSFMSLQKVLHLLDLQVWNALVRRIAPNQAVRLAVFLAKEPGVSQPGSRAGEFSYQLVKAVLQIAGPVGRQSLQELLEQLSPGDHPLYWSGLFYQLSPDVLVREEVLSALAASLQGLDGAPLAGIVLKRVLSRLTLLSIAVLEAVDHLAWTELVYIERSAFDEDDRVNMDFRVRLIVKLLANRATFPLSLHLAQVLRRLVPETPEGMWVQNVLQADEIEPLKRTSPSSYERLHPRRKKDSVIFLPANFRIELPAPAVALEHQSAAQPTKWWKR